MIFFLDEKKIRAKKFVLSHGLWQISQRVFWKWRGNLWGKRILGFWLQLCYKINGCKANTYEKLAANEFILDLIKQDCVVWIFLWKKAKWRPTWSKFFPTYGLLLIIRSIFWKWQEILRKICLDFLKKYYIFYK